MNKIFFSTYLVTIFHLYFHMLLQPKKKKITETCMCSFSAISQTGSQGQVNSLFPEMKVTAQGITVFKKDSVLRQNDHFLRI